LAAYGGVAITGEELIELPLEGSYGDGVCYQTTTGRGPGGFQQSFRRMLSAGARLVMIDEIRDQETATEALRASVDGYLVISTMVAESVTQALAKLGALAGERMGGEAARTLLADGVAGVLHQQIQPGLKRALKTEVLMLQDAPASRALLRGGRFDLLTFDIKKQMAAMIAANAATPAAMR
jgi:twitching motility protein PilT